MNDTRQKIFRLAPAQDEMTSVILQTRRDALTDPDLSDGAKVLFCILLDWSLWPGKNKGPGVVTISTTKLRELMGRSARAIWGWKKELIEKRLIWITEWLIPNAWPLHTYHISSIHPQEHGGEMVTQDGLWGNGYRRHQPERGVGARGSTQRKLPLRSTKQHVTAAGKTSVSSDSGTGNRKNQHQPVAESAVANRTECDGEPQDVRRGTADSAVGNRTKGHPATAQNDTPPPQNPAHLIEGESPKVRGSDKRMEGAKACPSLPLPTFQPLDWGMWASKRRTEGDRQIEYLKEKIFALENSRKPAPNQKDLVAAYRQRIREVKSWMAGEVSQK